MIGIIEQVGLFIALLGLLVFIHELGHFLVAKLAQVRVEVFSLGFGPRLLGFRRGETDYRVSAIPLGGYVRMTGEVGGEESDPNDPLSFVAKPRWSRFLIMVSGAAFNIILAILIWTGLFTFGIHVPVVVEGPPTADVVVPGGPADRAGLSQGDVILSVGGEEMADHRSFTRAVMLSPGATLDFEVLREGRRLVVPVTLDTVTSHHLGDAGLYPRMSFQVTQVFPDSPAARAGFQVGDHIVQIDGKPVEGEDHLIGQIQESEGRPLAFTLAREGTTRTIEVMPVAEDGVWRIGVGFGRAMEMEYVKLGVVGALVRAVSTAWDHAGDLFYTLRKLILMKVGLWVMSGPLEIASVLHETAKAGLVPLFHLVAWISLQLGVLNLLPIPVLDGGHIMILGVEGLARRDLAYRIKEKIMLAGLVFLLLFMGTIVVFDVLKRFIAAGG